MLIRNPVFGNTFSLDDRVTIHETVDSELLVFRAKDKPIVQGFKMGFTALTEAEKDRLQAFFEGAAAEVIVMVDHEEREWTGMVVSNEIVFKEGKGCKWETDFEFEGTPVTTEP